MGLISLACMPVVVVNERTMISELLLPEGMDEVAFEIVRRMLKE